MIDMQSMHRYDPAFGHFNYLCVLFIDGCVQPLLGHLKEYDLRLWQPA